jgi:hypothetical protein
MPLVSVMGRDSLAIAIRHALSGKGVDLCTGVNRANAVLLEIDVDASALGSFEDIEAFDECGFPVLQGVKMPAFGESPRGCASKFVQLLRRCAVAHDFVSNRVLTLKTIRMYGVAFPASR